VILFKQHFILKKSLRLQRPFAFGVVYLERKAIKVKENIESSYLMTYEFLIVYFLCGDIQEK